MIYLRMGKQINKGSGLVKEPGIHFFKYDLKPKKH